MYNCASDVTITLKSSADTYLFLLSGSGTGGSVVAENDDIEPNTVLDSRIETRLEAGTYTIEATTYHAATEDIFTLTVSGIDTTPP